MADVLIASVSNPRCQEMTAMPAVTANRAQILGGPPGNGAVSCSLKRKRPPKIEIPNALREISADALKMRAGEGQTEGAGSFADDGVCVFASKGKKKFMEDAHKIFSSPNGDKAFFGVYDGHGGSKAAEFVTENLHLKILEMLDDSSGIQEKVESVKRGYLKTDEEFLKQGLGSGVCCLTALIQGREMIVSNLGDCRAVLCRDGIAEPMTTDHNPGHENERRRIEQNGGYVEFHRGSWRVHGTLAVSRSIGDGHLKNWVIAEPDTKVVHLDPGMEYLVLASDGLWQEVDNQEAIDIVKKHLMSSSSSSSSKVVYDPTTGHRLCSFNQKRNEGYENGNPRQSKCRRISFVDQMKVRSHFPNDENDVLSTCDGLMAACKELVDLAVTRGSLDDITVMVVDLSRHM